MICAILDVGLNANFYGAFIVGPILLLRPVLWERVAAAIAQNQWSRKAAFIAASTPLYNTLQVTLNFQEFILMIFKHDIGRLI